jgi:hypothetical protein
LFKETNHLVDIYGFTGTEAFKMVLPVSHAEDMKPFSSPGWKIDVFSGKSPSIIDIAFGTNIGFVSKEKVDFSFGIKHFKCLQLLRPVLTELR